MARRREADERGRRAAAAIRGRIGVETRQARVAAGASQGAAAREAGMSRSQYGRIERGELAGLTVDQACRVAAAVGLGISVSVWPDGDPVRDAGQQRLRGRLRDVLPTAAGWQSEVPMLIPGDKRAWDAVIRLAGRRGGCECEMRLRDMQALERRLRLKLRDGDVDVLLLVVADTAANRRVLRLHREELRPLLPLDSREVLAALRAGRLPGANGMVIL